MNIEYRMSCSRVEIKIVRRTACMYGEALGLRINSLCPLHATRRRGALRSSARRAAGDILSGLPAASRRAIRANFTPCRSPARFLDPQRLGHCGGASTIPSATADATADGGRALASGAGGMVWTCAASSRSAPSRRPSSRMHYDDTETFACARSISSTSERRSTVRHDRLRPLRGWTRPDATSL